MRAQEALKGAAWWAGRPVALESGGHHPALPCPRLLTPTKGSGGRGFMAEGIYGRDNSLFSELQGLSHPGSSFTHVPAAPKWGFQLELWGPPLGWSLRWPHFPSVRSPTGSACSCEPSMNPRERRSGLEGPLVRAKLHPGSQSRGRSGPSQGRNESSGIPLLFPNRSLFMALRPLSSNRLSPAHSFRLNLLPSVFGSLISS